jgi:hypothetical protein
VLTLRIRQLAEHPAEARVAFEQSQRFVQGCAVALVFPVAQNPGQFVPIH